MLFRSKKFKEFIETHYKIPVVIGTHPIPMKYYIDHEKMSFWDSIKMKDIAPELFKDTDEIMKSFD